jgi:hypothetical protein
MPKVIPASLIVFLFVLLPAEQAAHAAESLGEVRTWSVNLGPNAKNWGYAGVTKDFLVNEHLSLFVTGGLGTFIVGSGVAYYTQAYAESSFVFSGTVGIVGADVNACYQLKTSTLGFFTAGISYGEYFMQYRGFLPVLSYEMRF